jgi:hypothetical protein
MSEVVGQPRDSVADVVEPLASRYQSITRTKDQYYISFESAWTAQNASTSLAWLFSSVSHFQPRLVCSGYRGLRFPHSSTQPPNSPGMLFMRALPRNLTTITITVTVS